MAGLPHVLHIQGGRVYDPVHRVDGDVRDVWIIDGVVAEPPTEQDRASLGDIDTLDARGKVVMPGAVEMHAHLASGTVQAARRIQANAHTPPVVPTAQATGDGYAQLGYTTGIEAAVAPRDVAMAHAQLDALPHLDTAILLLLGNHEGLIERIEQSDDRGAIELLQTLLTRSGAFGIKAVNPAAVAAWRRDPLRQNVDDLDKAIPAGRSSPRRVLDVLTAAAEEMALSHPTHIHGPQLGEPGAIDITLDMLKGLSGRRMHLAHLQYYAYRSNDKGQHVSAVDELLTRLSDLPTVTADLGLIAFGPAFTATADVPLEHALYRHVGTGSTPAYFLETGNEDCFGVMPLEHRAKNAVTAVQWATGLELALKWDDPWRYALTIDHPNGGSFVNYPTLIACLMNKAFRDAQLEQCHQAATDRTGLASLERELSLLEIATITRAAPARALGLTRKGHLGVGADGDVTVYLDRTDDPEAMFAAPSHVVKAGRVIARGGKALGNDEGIATANSGRRLRAGLTISDRGEHHLQQWLAEHGTLSARQYGVPAAQREAMTAVGG